MEPCGAFTYALTPPGRSAQQPVLALAAQTAPGLEEYHATTTFLKAGSLRQIAGQLVATVHAVQHQQECRVLVDVRGGYQMLVALLTEVLADEARVLAALVTEGDGLDWSQHGQVTVGQQWLEQRLVLLADDHRLHLVDPHAATDARVQTALALSVLGDPYQTPIAFTAARLWADPWQRAWQQEQDRREQERLARLPPAERAEVLRQQAILAERDRQAAARVQRSLDWLAARGRWRVGN